MATNAQKIVQRLNFTREDLNHNRRGELSTRQKEILVRGGRNAIYLFGGLALLMTPILWFASDDFGQFLMLEGVILAFCAFMAFGSRLVTGQEAKEGKVESIVGRPSLKRRIKGGKYKKVFFIGEKDFSDKWLHNLLNENRQYRVYFAPKTGKIVSIEPYRQQ